MVRIVFQNPDGSQREVEVEPGTRVLDAAQAHGLEMEGACEGSMACSTCHVILSDADFERFPPPREEEDDLLDIAFGARPTSRLGCQVTVEAAHEGVVFTLPPQTRSLLF